jgi:hypothetical protein
MAMQLTDDLPGRRDGLRATHLRNHLLRKDKNKLFGLPAGKGKPAPPRWRTWRIVEVAEIVVKHGVAMRKLLKLDAEEEEVTTQAERLVEASARIDELEGQLEQAKIERAAFQSAQYIYARRLETKAEERRTAVALARAKGVLIVCDCPLPRSTKPTNPWQSARSMLSSGVPGKSGRFATWRSPIALAWSRRRNRALRLRYRVSTAVRRSPQCSLPSMSSRRRFPFGKRRSTPARAAHGRRTRSRLRRRWDMAAAGAGVGRGAASPFQSFSLLVSEQWLP